MKDWPYFYIKQTLQIGVPFLKYKGYGVYREIFELNTNLKDWYEMHSEAIRLANTLRDLEIEPLIQNLKVE